LHKEILDREKRMLIKNEQALMEHHTEQLLEKFQLEEADIKIQSLEKVLNILNKKTQ
jgi:hypothetical protein